MDFILYKGNGFNGNLTILDNIFINQTGSQALIFKIMS